MFSDDEDDYDDKLAMTPLGSSCHESPLPPCSLPSNSPLPRHTPDSPSHPGIKLENNNNNTSLLDTSTMGLLTKIKTEEGDYADYDKDVGDGLHQGDGDKIDHENRSPDEAGNKKRSFNLSTF